MGNCIYKRMIDESPIAFIHIKVLKDDNSNLIDIKVKDYNKAYKHFFIETEIFKTYFLRLDKRKWGDILDQAKTDLKFNKDIYISELDLYFNVEIYYSKDDEYFVRFNKISKQYMKLSSTLKDSPFMSWIKDKNGIYVDVNNKFLKFLNKSYEEVIGKSDFDIFEKNMAIKIKNHDNYLFKNKKLYVYEEFISANKNKKAYFQTAKWIYTDEDNTTLGTIGISVEVTNKIEFLKSIEKNEKIFLDIAKNIQEVIIIADEKKVHYVSESFEKVFGHSPHDLYKDINAWKNLWDEIEYEEMPMPYNFKDPYSINFKLKKSGEDSKWFWSRCVSILDENGNIIKKIIVISDITEDKKLEREIEKLRMDFFANLSHELRTPINLILSSLQVIGLKMDTLNKENFNYFDKYLGIIGQNGKRLLKLVNNLIDTTKLDSGQFDYSPGNQDIVSFIENICLSVASFVEMNNMNIIFDTNVEEHIVGFDEDNIERVMLNLISNAIKFNKPNGTIEVILECGKNIKITIKDSGIGIPSDKLETIFGRFEQVKDKFKNSREGSGIGLTLVKSLIEMNKGNISVNSKLGEGSEFIIEIPNEKIKNIDKNNKYNYSNVGNIERINIEFSDIYI